MSKLVPQDDEELKFESIIQIPRDDRICNVLQGNLQI